MRMSRWRALVAAGLAAALLLGAVVGAAGAAPADGSRQAFLDRLAAALGVPRDKLEAAVREAALGVLDDAVRAGRIPAERAERIRRRLQQAEIRLFPPFGRPFAHGHGSWPGIRDVVRAAAGVLGLTPQELLSQLHQGKTLAQIAAERGRSRDEVKQAILAPVRQRLERAVAAGRLSQERMEARLKALETRIDTLLDRPWPPMPRHRTQPPGGQGSGT